MEVTKVIYLMNSAVMPAGNYGCYEYAAATVAELGDVVSGKLGDWRSTIGYPQNAELIQLWTGHSCPVCRIETFFRPGDRALVMRLTKRVANPATKGNEVSSSPDDWEFAWVTFTG